MARSGFRSASRFVPDFDIYPRIAAHELEIHSQQIQLGEQTVGHAHANVELNYMEGGEITYLHCGRFQTIQAGQLGVFWAGYPHRIYGAEQAAKLWWITVPLRDFLGWELSPAWVRRVMAGELLTGSPQNGELDLAMIQRWEQDQAKPALHRAILLEVQARLIRLDGELKQKRRGSRQHKTGHSTLHPAALRMASYLTEHFHEPITQPQVAQAVGLNASYAARLFKQQLGTTMGRYLEELRVAYAQNLLQHSEAKIVDVAFASGFQSSSRFYAAFKSVLGRTPSDFRQLMQT